MQLSKNLYFWENYDYIEKRYVAILTFLMAASDAQQNFMLTKYILYPSISIRSKVKAFFFVKKLPKLNILSVIAIDQIRIFK